MVNSVPKAAFMHKCNAFPKNAKTADRLCFLLASAGFEKSRIKVVALALSLNALHLRLGACLSGSSCL